MFAARASALTTMFRTPVVSASFVTRDSSTGNLMLDGQRFRFAGGNTAHDIGPSQNANGRAYGGTLDAANIYLTPHTQIDAYLNSAASMNATVVRAYAAAMSVGSANTPQPTVGVYNDAALEPLDYALQQCGDLGIRFVIPLCDAAGSSSNVFWYCTQNGVTPDSFATQFYTNATVIASFKAFVTHIMNHVNIYTGIAYKNDPGVLAWETGNELRASNDFATSRAILAPWTDDISEHIKVTCGAQQLVMDGAYGFYNGSVFDETSLALPYVDIYSDHSYQSTLNPTWLEAEAQAAHSFSKAYCLGEYTWTDSGGWTLTQMLAAIEASPWWDGDMFWDLLAPLTNWGDGFTLHYPGDNSNMITRATQLANHATAMQGPAPGLPAKTETLIDTFTTLDTTTVWGTRGSPAITSGQLWIPGGSGTPGIYSLGRYDFLDSSIVIELVDASPSTGQSFTAFWLSTLNNDAANSVGFLILGHSSMSFRQTFGGSVSETTETYSTTNHRWLRLRESGGTVFWDTSDNGTAWTNKRSLATSLTSLQMARMYVILTATPWGTDPSVGTAKFDNFNNTPIPTPSLPPLIYRPNYGALLQV